MQAIILAAGSGKRLGGNIPKPLLTINDQPLLVRLIEQFKSQGVDEIVVVTGYQKHLLEDAVAPLSVSTAFNPFYSVSDNLASFWIGQQFISDACIMAHGDIILEDELLRSLIEAEGDIVLPMDTSSLDVESMKMKVVDGKLEDLSKTIPLKEAAGESLPLMKFSRAPTEELKKLTESVLTKGQLHKFIDDAVLELVRSDKFSTTVLDVTGCNWVEIDTRSDLERARELFG